MVSVIVPNFNYGTYLVQRIDSILNQSYQNFELIILDDNSTDDSKAIIENYRNNPKVSHIVYNEVNSGSPFVQWNKGIELAIGEWIWIAEADDLAEEQLLEQLVQNASQHNGVVISYCQSNRMDAEGLLLGDWKDWTDDVDENLFKNDFVLGGNEYIENFLIRKNTIPNASAVIFRKEDFISVGRTDEDIKFCADWLLWLKILTQGDISFCSQKLNHFRFHPKSAIATSDENGGAFNMYKYYFPLRKKFIVFLKEGYKNKIIKREYIKFVIVSISLLAKEYELEAENLKRHGFDGGAIYNMTKALQFSANKKRILMLLLIKYLPPRSIRKKMKSLFFVSKR